VFYITLYDTGYSTENLFGLKLPEIKLLSAEKLGLIGCFYALIGCFYALGVVICLEQGADLHMAQLMPLPLTVSCFSIIQIGFTFLVPAHPGSPGKRAVK